MGKRVYEKARELGMENKELIAILRDLGFDAKNPSASFTDEMEEKLSLHLKGEPKGKDTELPETPKEIKKEDETRRARLERISKKISSVSGVPVSPKKIVEVKPSPPKVLEKTVPKTTEVEVRIKTKPKKLKPLKVVENMTVREFAETAHVDIKDVLRACMTFGVMATANQRLGLDVIEAVADEFGYFAILVTREEFLAPPEPIVLPETPAVKAPSEESLKAEVAEEPEIEVEKRFIRPKAKKAKRVEKAKKPKGVLARPPVVTVMGHVDHGKTTLLDYIRKTNVVAGEKGGITQHIGAYEVETKFGKITFIDTPGHEAFTAMRARGARVTDIVVLVVSQDDGVMPQTKEAINHARAAGVPIIVAINKMDMPGANSEKVKNDLAKNDLIIEEWGGDVLSADISAVTGEGVDSLLELIALQAEMLELVANPEGTAKGVVIEATLDKLRGATATILVQEGTLRVGDSIVAGICPGKVRGMEDERGKRKTEAGPSTPVKIIGLDCVPQAGDEFTVVGSEAEARKIAQTKKAVEAEEITTPITFTLEQYYSRMKEGEIKELPIVLKVDVDGSLDAIKRMLERISSDEAKLKIIHAGVGAVNENDIHLAETSKAIVISFNIKPDSRALKLAEKKKIDLKYYDIIYELDADIRAALEGLLKPQIVEERIGIVEVRQIFRIPKVGSIAGSFVQEGFARRGAKLQVSRAGEIIGEGSIKSLKRFKDDVKEVQEGFECGIEITGFNDVVEGDILYLFETKEITRRLSTA